MNSSRAKTVSYLITTYNFKYGAEIGVDEGLTSLALLQEHSNLVLICIDTWGQNAFGDQVLCSNYDYGELEKKFKAVMKKLSCFRPERAKVMRMLSNEAAKLIKPRSLDFVFIDADHEFLSVLDDLKTWTPKVRKGGLIIGHDYTKTNIFPHIIGVAKAVDQYFSPAEVVLYEDTDLPGVFIWAVQKT